MNEIKITIEGLNELTAALLQLCAASVPAGASGSQAPMQAITTLPVQQNPSYPAQQQLQQVPAQVPVQQQAPAQQSIPVQPPIPTQVPTTAVAQKFTQDMLAVAAAGLVNQGKQARLIEILHGFGVNTLIELPEAQYGAFAGALRMEGAVING